MIIAGGIKYGDQIVKSLALGADGTAMGRPFIIASAAGEKEFNDGSEGVRNFVKADSVEIQQLVSSMGKYDIKELDSSDVQALDMKVARMFGIKYLYD